MAETKTKTITLTGKDGTFTTLFGRLKKNKKKSEVSDLRALLSNEKARLLHTIKTKKPESIYKLAKILGRDFKAVRADIKLLERFGFIELISSYKQGRERLQPIIDTDKVVITINLK
ncbi:HTH domain-containing protein [archaeon]|jgi:predicted transcriptional regulator|nr:HTH domain-containing protein [archaeon]MBT4242193.1 HTH domain-containing protein [archaeon]MBT4417881.1 HTH domain-containing protein [archaeon]